MTEPLHINRLALFIFLLGVSSYIIAVINRSSFASLGPTAQEYFAVDATILGTFAVMQLVLYTVMQIPVGILVHRFGPTRVIISGALFMVLGQTLLAFSTAVWMVILARILVGIGDACTFVSVLRLQAHWFPLRQLPIWTQITSQLGQLGQIVSIIPFALLVTSVGWVSGFLTIALITLVIAAFSIVFLKDGSDRQTVLAAIFTRGSAQVTFTGSVRTSGVFADLAAQFRRIPSLLRIPGVRLAFWIHFVSSFSIGVFVIMWGYPFLVGGLGLSRETAAALITCGVIAGVVTGLILGPVSARFHMYRVHIALGLMAVMVAVWTIVLIWPNGAPIWMLLIMMIVTAAGGPLSMTAFDVLRDYAPPKAISLGTGLVNTGAFISSIITLFFVGLLLDLQDAGTPATYELSAFNVAMASQYLCWGIGIFFIVRENSVLKRLAANRKSKG